MPAANLAGAEEVHSFTVLLLVVIRYISFVASYIEMPERNYPKYWRGFMAFLDLVSWVFTIAGAMFVQPKAALDALCGVTCVTSVTMQAFMGIVSDTDSEVSMGRFH